jgi:hypothetical protein
MIVDLKRAVNTSVNLGNIESKKEERTVIG